MTSGPATRRRRPGSLGAEVLALLRSARRALTAGELLRALGDDLAYSTVATVLSRMHDKGVLTRTKQRRSYAYAPVTDSPGMTARRMHQALESDPDREAVLARFVDKLPATDEELLRRLLGIPPEERRCGGDRDARQQQGLQVRGQDRHGSPHRELKQHPGE
ncbi:BlaI/MecI/CopY family transcriptional regulator [Streptomyces sp. NPDC001982]|uniref:BlaI/MecI/CopY family transcriptional regulator n=1 Tax=Streptomyces sp. NPDC001982 TaxID=3154405 RepID=UPI003329AA27